MKYPDGQEVKLGDRLKLWERCYGVVVVCLDAGAFGREYPKDEWEYLKQGVLIDSDKAGLIHYLQPECSLELLERG